MRGAGASGIFLLASWRLGFTLFLWITTIFFLLLVFKCLKSLALALKDQGLTLLGPDSSGPSSVQQDRLCRTTRSAPSEVRLTSARHALSRPSRISPSQPETSPVPHTLAAEPPPYHTVAESREAPPTYASLYPEEQPAAQRPNILPV